MSPINTGFVRPAVATAPTVYGIETDILNPLLSIISLLQQHLPFTVLKLHDAIATDCDSIVATAPTVYGIETFKTVALIQALPTLVATAPTVYGIETKGRYYEYIAPTVACCNSTYRLRY